MGSPAAPCPGQSATLFLGKAEMMRTPPPLIATLLAVVCAGWFVGCKSAPKKESAEEMIAEFEVKLTTATTEHADTEANLALIVEYDILPKPTRDRYEFGKRKFTPGEQETIKVKTRKSIPWNDRDKLTLRIATESEDGYLPSHIWIAAISDQKQHFTLRDNPWKDRMFSTEVTDAEAVWPVVVASEWTISNTD